MLWLRLFIYNNIRRPYRNRQAWKLFGPQWTAEGKPRAEFPFAQRLTMDSINWAATAALAISNGQRFIASPPPETPELLVRHLQGFQEFMVNRHARQSDEDAGPNPTYH